jgi:hypothetical protein
MVKQAVGNQVVSPGILGPAVLGRVKEHHCIIYSRSAAVPECIIAGAVPDQQPDGTALNSAVFYQVVSAAPVPHVESTGKIFYPAVAYGIILAVPLEAYPVPAVVQVPDTFGIAPSDRIAVAPHMDVVVHGAQMPGGVVVAVYSAVLDQIAVSHYGEAFRGGVEYNTVCNGIVKC